MPGLKQFSYLLFLLITLSCSKKIIPVTPAAPPTVKLLDSLPLSDIDIPIRINLRPLYAMAEKEVQQVYTSPGYPNDFVVDNCDTRYMYHFRRGPLQIRSAGNSLQFGFTGYYRIAGGQRICTGTGSERTAVSPWSPTCTCGLREGDRKVNVAFSASMKLLPDYRVAATVNRLDPKPIDKCEICLFNIDITSLVMGRLAAQLDDARKGMLDTLSRISLKPQFQKIWDLLTTVQPVYGYGYLQINPQQLRLSDIRFEGDTMLITVGLSARPVVTQIRPKEVRTVVPNLSPASAQKGFSIYTDAYLDYDSLSAIVNSQVRKKKIDLEKTGKYVVVEDCRIFSSGADQLVMKVRFSGARPSESGEFLLTGKPVYDQASKQLSLQNLDFDIRSRSMLLKTAEWLLSSRILQTLEGYARFDVRQYEQMAMQRINANLNSEIRKGVRMEGKVNNMGIERIYPFTDYLVVRFSSKGDLELKVNSLNF